MIVEKRITLSGSADDFDFRFILTVKESREIYYLYDEGYRYVKILNENGRVKAIFFKTWRESNSELCPVVYGNTAELLNSLTKTLSGSNFLVSKEIYNLEEIVKNIKQLK